jgi:hypothetical protein
MLLLVFIIIVIYGALLKKKKNFWLICTLFFIVMVNTSVNQADFANYEHYYYLINEGIVDYSYLGMSVGWSYLCIIIGKLGLSYYGMSAIVIFISMFLIHTRIKSMDFNENLFWSLFIIFPGLIQCIQLRFFLGTSLVFWGLVPLLRKEKNSLVKYIIITILAYFIHSSCLIFLIFAFLPVFEYLGAKKTLLISFISLGIIYFGSQYILNIIAMLIPKYRFERYFSSSISKTTFLWFIKIFIIWLYNFCAYKYYYIRCNNKNIEICTNGNALVREKKYDIFFNRCINAISLLVITIIFLAFDSNFHRFLEVGFMLLYIIYAYYLTNFNLSNKERTQLFLFMIVNICIVTYIYTPFETVIKPFFLFSGFHSIFY